MKAGRNHGKNKSSAVRQAEEKEKKSKTHRAGQAPIGLAVSGKKQSLLLHACCAPCATHVIEQLSRSYSVTALFYNPNIQPDEEYQRRLQAMRRLCGLTNTQLLVDSCAVSVWDGWVQGLEDEPEQGRRCLQCFNGRLEYTVRMADRLSPRKPAAEINAIGVSVAANARTCYLESDFKKKDGFKRSCELSKHYDLYRQNYCGCLYSLRDRDAL